MEQAGIQLTPSSFDPSSRKPLNWRLFSAYLLKSGFRVAILREGFLSSFLGFGLRAFLMAASLGLLAPICVADTSTPITLDTNETLFAVLTAMNSCGYDVNLNASDAQRLNIRAEVQKNLRGSDEAQLALKTMCDWYAAHQGKDPHSRSVAVCVAGALPAGSAALSSPGERRRDASGCGAHRWLWSLLERFYEKADLHSVWERHRANYAALVERYHVPLAKMVFDTDIYLKLQSGGFLGRTFTIYLDFLGDPNEANARNYGADYYVVVFPSPDPNSTQSLKMEQIRHTYLHYLLDPMAEKHFSSIKRLEPLLQSVKTRAAGRELQDRYLTAGH